MPVLRALNLLSDGDLPGAADVLAGFSVDDVQASHDLEPLALLAGVVAAAGSDAQQQRVYDRLEPFHSLHAIVGGCASYWGTVDHHLGRLAAGLGRHEQARDHFSSAAAAYERLGAPAWAVLCRDELRGLPAPDGGRERSVFHFDGGSWEVVFGGREVHLPDAKGLRDLAVLLSSPGRMVHVRELVGVDDPGGADPMLDERARAAYRARLSDLEAEIDEARSWQDPVRAERAEAERDALVHELAAAAGLAGRTRRLGDVTEKARKTVSARIRDALRRVDHVHPELAEHLRASVTTGTECSYAPDRPVRWTL